MRPIQRPVKALISIHDVMPETLDQVDELLHLCEQHQATPVTLLIVPGKAWQPADFDQLRAMLERGALLAGHGWQHKIDPKQLRGTARLHSLLLSRNVAEHLALPPAKIRSLILRCYNWFADHALPNPKLYVPPAWAMGRLSHNDLDRLPFRYYETFFGIYDNLSRKFTYSPLTGYEADTNLRAITLTTWNHLNRTIARYHGPLRVGIHPFDLTYKLHTELTQTLGMGFQIQAQL